SAGAVCVPFLFFQAEDGIRARNVTGVQTCALPICPSALEPQHTLDHAVPDGDQPRAFSREELGRTRLADTVDGPDLLPCRIEAFVALQLLQLCVGELPEIPVRFAGEIGL